MFKVAFSVRPLRSASVTAVTRALRPSTAVFTPSTAVDRDQTRANAGDGLTNLALLDFTKAFSLTFFV